MATLEEIHLSSSPAESQSDFRLYLQAEFAKRCTRNPRYTLSAFARTLGVDKSTLAKILRGQRQIRAKAIRRLGLKLGLNPEKLTQFEEASPRKNARGEIRNRQDEVDKNFARLSLDTFQVISDWYHYAILELMRLPHFTPEFAWIARVLGISPLEVELAVDRLQRLEMIEIHSDGTWKDSTGGHSTTLGNPFTAAAFRNMQNQLLEKAIVALEVVPFDRRSQTSMTMAIDPKRMPEAKKLIDEFRRKMNEFLSPESEKNLEEVYALTISLFPLSESNPPPLK